MRGMGIMFFDHNSFVSVSKFLEGNLSVFQKFAGCENCWGKEGKREREREREKKKRGRER